MNIFIGLLFVIGLSAIFVAILWKFHVRDRLVYILFGVSLLIHVIAVLFIYGAQFQPFSGGDGDYTSYHKSAVLIADEIGKGNFFPNMETRGVPHYFPLIIGYVYFFTTPSMVVGQLFNAWIASMVIMLLYFIIFELTQSLGWAFGIGLLANLYPSFLFFSSLLLKDVFVLLFVLMAVFLMLRILKRFSWGLFALFYICLILLTNFRFYEGFVLLVTFTTSWFLLSRQPIKTLLAYGSVMVFLLGFVPQMFGMGYYGFTTLRQYINPATVTYYQDVAYTGKDVVVTPPPTPPPVPSTPVEVTPTPPPVPPSASPTPKVVPVPPPASPILLDEPTPESSEKRVENIGFASTVDLKVDFSSPGVFITTFLKAFAFVAVGPFPWQFAAKRHYFALLETIPWTILSVLILLGIIHALKSRHRVLSLAIFSAGLFLILLIYMNNFGITMRIRMPAFFLLAAFVPFGVLEYLRWKDYIIKRFKI